MHALRIFPGDTTAVERQSSGKQGLTGHYHSTPVTLISWWASSLSPPSPSPSLFPHIPVFISFPSPPDFVSLGSRREERKGDGQEHREIERQQMMTIIRWKLTEMDRRMQAGREKEERSCIYLTCASLCNHCPFGYACNSKMPLVSQYPVKICHSLYAAHPISLRHPSFIEFSQPSLSHLVCKYTIAVFPFSSMRLLLLALIFFYSSVSAIALYFLLLLTRTALLTFPTSMLLPQSSLPLLPLSYVLLRPSSPITFPSPSCPWWP